MGFGIGDRQGLNTAHSFMLFREQACSIQGTAPMLHVETREAYGSDQQEHLSIPIIALSMQMPPFCSTKDFS
jgi:hypothetical protein